MTRFSLRTACFTLITIILSSIFVACTTTFKPPKDTVSGYKNSDLIPLKVGLVLNDRLRHAKFEKEHILYRIPLGENLSRNSEKLIRKLFTDVVIGKNMSDFKQGAVDVVVIPTMVTTEMTLPAWSFGKGTFTIFLEWKFLDKNGQLIWVDTARGMGEGDEWTIPRKIKQAIDALFKNSHEVISNAQEIKGLAQSNEK